MSTFSKRLTLAMGVVAGAALAVFAVSRSGRKEIKRLSDKTAGMRDELRQKVKQDFSRIKKMSNRFI